VFILQSEEAFLMALTLFRDAHVGEELELVTFDKKLSRIQNCQLLVTELL